MFSPLPGRPREHAVKPKRPLKRKTETPPSEPVVIAKRGRGRPPNSKKVKTIKPVIDQADSQKNAGEYLSPKFGRKSNYFPKYTIVWSFLFVSLTR